MMDAMKPVAEPFCYNMAKATENAWYIILFGPKSVCWEPCFLKDGVWHDKHGCILGEDLLARMRAFTVLNLPKEFPS